MGGVEIFGERIDIETIASISRDTAGRGVRLGDETLLLKTGHLGADSGTRDIKKLGQGDTTDRGGELGVFLNDGEEDGALAVGDIHTSIIAD